MNDKLPAPRIAPEGQSNPMVIVAYAAIVMIAICPCSILIAIFLIRTFG